MQSVIIQRTIISSPPSQAFSFYYTWHCPIIVKFALMWHITRITPNCSECLMKNPKYITIIKATYLQYQLHSYQVLFIE
jgi:hypothetical protein